jgi:hypothetical protein
MLIKNFQLCSVFFSLVLSVSNFIPHFLVFNHLLFVIFKEEFDPEFDLSGADPSTTYIETVVMSGLTAITVCVGVNSLTVDDTGTDYVFFTAINGKISQ